MSKPASSPTRFSGDMDHFYDPTFTQEISQKMRVPKRIKVDGESDDLTNNHSASSWHQNEKISMNVPDRILLIDNVYMDITPGSNSDYSGQEQHFGTRAPPREFQHENSVMPPPEPPGMVRVQTPPRVITLEDHCFPSADDDFRPTASEQFTSHERSNARVQRPLDLSNDQRSAALPQIRELMPSGGEGMTTAEEVVHLRRQLAKLNRRVMTMELNSLQQQHREKVMYAVVAAYFVLKGLMWLNR